MCPTPMTDDSTNLGLPLKKGQLVEINIPGIRGIYCVARDVEWNQDFQVWGSVCLEGVPVPIFTHKGGIKIVKG